MEILAVCGFGVGSSMVLKMTLDKVFKELGVDANVQTMDLSSAKGAKPDAIFTSKEIAKDLRNSTTSPVYEVEKYMDKQEVKSAVEKFINENKK
ncbi:PTS sugar transporter subunit IIB [Senegalia massiliensis]|jgi:PTS system ascorbate-specific IIB component|uniref:PTS sugar transporter subunit IIB n=1 Tax=Senegalia massiliensis TaxID=1720316 RepID=A0A845QVL7_9CLOT|nr:PTS sugar transporter subunit IIB [Senegalia massiliensis]NBI06044.1 PTS sugar transporter subunit IIB [Senegalia massiliensis]